MSAFAYRRGTLWAEEVRLAEVAESVGTPTYVYSAGAIEAHFRALDQAFAGTPHLICYAVKACSNLAILALLAERGAGFDIVSGGELERVRAATGNPGRTVFSGVGKTKAEMAAALSAGILLFNVESAEELDALAAVGREQKKQAAFAVRVNPDVDARTHRYIATGLESSKFGVPLAEAAQLYRRARKLKGVVARGVDCHIGSQLTDLSPLRTAVKKVADFYREMRSEGAPLQYLDAGGGLGITYLDERPPSAGEYAKAILEPTRGLEATLVVEPGRVIVGNAGVLLTQVLYRKPGPKKQFVVVDAGMNDLMRPALYEAHHEVLPLVKRRSSGRGHPIELVGPVCESSDVLARGRNLPLPRPGELLAVMSAGAYGMSMASNYNSRPRPAEVLVEGTRYRVVRPRERTEELWRSELP